MFGHKLVSFNAFPSIGESSLDELNFVANMLPYKTLDISKELKPVHIVS